MQMHSFDTLRDLKGHEVHLRLFSIENDPVDELTHLLNRSYKSLADMGFRYVASYQDSDRTVERIKNAACLIATVNDKIIATVSYYDPSNTTYPGFSRDTKVAHFGQFAVEPSLQGSGIGSRLIEHIERFAFQSEVDELALDTAENASHLVSYYNRKGYRFITHVQWDETNYRSVIMSKKLAEHYTS